MIEEAYVSFETAKLLKEKGFDELCHHYYKNNDLMFSPSLSSRNSFQTNTYSAPTQQMAMRWLREVNNIVIVVTPSMYWGKYNVSIYKRGNDYPIGFDGDSLCPSYEQACETAIKYCLENLI